MDTFLNILPYLAMGALLIGIVVLVTLPKKGMTTQEIAVCAVCLAASFALSFFKVSFVSNGGSVTLAAILPLCVYAYFAGVKKGFLAGFIYSLLQIAQEPFVLGFFQVVLDYIIPFSVFGLIAVLKPLRKKLKGYDFLISLFVSYLVRYFCHVVSGVLYWGVNFPASLVYSATYVPFDFLIAAAAAAALIATKNMGRLEKMYNATVQNLQKKKENPQSELKEPQPSEQTEILITEQKESRPAEE